MEPTEKNLEAVPSSDGIFMPNLAPGAVGSNLPNNTGGLPFEWLVKAGLIDGRSYR